MQDAPGQLVPVSLEGKKKMEDAISLLVRFRFKGRFIMCLLNTQNCPRLPQGWGGGDDEDDGGDDDDGRSGSGHDGNEAGAGGGGSDGSGGENVVRANTY